MSSNVDDRFCNEQLYRETAEELNVNIELVKDIVNVQSEFTKDTIKKGAFESIRYVYLGGIKAKHSKVQRLNEAMGKDFNK